MLKPVEMAKIAALALDEKLGKNITVMHTTDGTVLADYFVICTANSTTQIKTLADEVERVLELNGERPLHRDGFRSGGWVVIDFGCVIVHIFMDEARKFYNLERLWADASVMDLSDIITPD